MRRARRQLLRQACLSNDFAIKGSRLYDVRMSDNHYDIY